VAVAAVPWKDLHEEHVMAKETKKRAAPSAESWSIALALLLSGVAILFFKYLPNYTPEHNSLRGVPGWVSLGYITIQLWMLLDSALRVRPTSVADAAIAIAPVITGIVCAVLWVVDYFQMSLYQLNALAMLTATGIVEFTTTLWVRNVVLQRGVSVIPGGGTSS
jgi:hypothetical protein